MLYLNIILIGINAFLFFRLERHKTLCCRGNLHVLINGELDRIRGDLRDEMKQKEKVDERNYALKLKWIEKWDGRQASETHLP